MPRRLFESSQDTISKSQLQRRSGVFRSHIEANRYAAIASSNPVRKIYTWCFVLWKSVSGAWALWTRLSRDHFLSLARGSFSARLKKAKMSPPCLPRCLPDCSEFTLWQVEREWSQHGQREDLSSHRRAGEFIGMELSLEKQVNNMLLDGILVSFYWFWRRGKLFRNIIKFWLIQFYIGSTVAMFYFYLWNILNI